MELLIYAHDSFTLACHLEGISAVLHASRTVCGVLQQAEEYNLMVCVGLSFRLNVKVMSPISHCQDL